MLQHKTSLPCLPSSQPCFTTRVELLAVRFCPAYSLDQTPQPPTAMKSCFATRVDLPEATPDRVDHQAGPRELTPPPMCTSQRPPSSEPRILSEEPLRNCPKSLPGTVPPPVSHRPQPKRSARVGLRVRGATRLTFGEPPRRERQSPRRERRGAGGGSQSDTCTPRPQARARARAGGGDRGTNMNREHAGGSTPTSRPLRSTDGSPTLCFLKVWP